MSARVPLKPLIGRRANTGFKIGKDDAFAQIVARIVEGQVRSFINDHPEMVRTAKDRTHEQIVCSIAKRIINDLVCERSRARIRAALVLTLDPPEACACGLDTARATGEAGVLFLASPVEPNAERTP